MNIQQKLQRILTATDWSQDDLAYHLDVTPKTLSFWMTGKAEPRTKHLTNIQNLYSHLVGKTSIDPESLNTLKSKALATHLSLRGLLHNEDLLRLTTLYLTYHTNTIEGSTMTLADVATVLDNENAIITNKSYREQAEARNHRAAFLFLLEQLKIEGKNFRWSSGLILETHKRLMNSLIDDAGSFRKYSVRIVGSSIARPSHISVPQKIQDLIDYMNTPTEDIIQRLAKTHAIFELIHPFGDGNGRTGRLIMFTQAMQYRIMPPLILKDRKHAYYRYLEHADKTQNYDLLSMLIAESILATSKLL